MNFYHVRIGVFREDGLLEPGLIIHGRSFLHDVDLGGLSASKDTPFLRLTLNLKP